MKDCENVQCRQVVNFLKMQETTCLATLYEYYYILNWFTHYQDIDIYKIW